jgi:hypothetical protein
LIAKNNLLIKNLRPNLLRSVSKEVIASQALDDSKRERERDTLVCLFETALKIELEYILNAYELEGMDL